MTNKIIVLCVAVSAFLGAAAFGAAIAGKDQDDAAELMAFQAATVSLGDAIRIAEAETGAPAIAAEFQEDDGVFVYEVETLSHTGVETEITISPANGDIIQIESGDDEDNDDDDDDDDNEDED